MSWLFQSKLAKSHFYVWYLGSKEGDGVRGSAVVLPAMRQLLKESFKKTPSKATVQISSKGLKLIQSVPAMSRSGKVKMQLVKFQIAANCITYSMTGKAPFDDVVGVVMLVLNPEMQSPMHVHCYRCDSAETAQIMHANIQVLLSRPETQRSIMDLEHRLFLSGLLLPRSRNPSTDVMAQDSSTKRTDSIIRVKRLEESIQPIERVERRIRNGSYGDPPEVPPRNRLLQNPNGLAKKDTRMPRRVVDELKNKLSSTGDLRKSRDMLPSYMDVNMNMSLHDSHASLSELPSDVSDSRYRLFGDTIMREPKSRSLDNLAESLVSTNLHGSDLLSTRRFPRSGVTDPFGQSYERTNTIDGFWKQKPRRANSIRINF